MFIDSRSIGEESVINTDVCIVGAGVSGLTLAREFKQAKFNTCIIESGGEKADKATQALYWGENVGIPYYPLDTARARFLGGSSHYWVIELPENGMGVRLRPMDPIDFEEREWVPYSGWPFKKEQLDPYYKRAQEVCQIGPNSYDPKDWIEPDRRNELPFHDDRVHTTIFQFGFRDVFFKEYANEVKNAENITTLLHGNAIEIETNEAATEVIRIRVACLNGNHFSVTAKTYILAMGGLEVPRLLLLSNKTQKSGLGNENDLVGRFFMEHPHLWCGAFFPSSVGVSNSTGLYEVYSKNGTPVMGKITLSESTLRKEKLLNWVTSVHPEYELSYKKYLGFYEPGVLACRAIKNDLLKNHSLINMKDHVYKALSDTNAIFRFIYRKTKSHYKRDFNRAEHITVYRLNPMVEQAPNPESCVFLGTEKDALGQFRINLNWQLTPLDTYTITRAQEILDEELRKAGLGHLLIETKKDIVPKGIHGGWHHMGTTRMHADPKKGVVDPTCRVHGISNLYIGGASVFPTSGYANPVLTTIALVLRLADHVRKTMDA
ncbi:MAG: GMC family oxidoreductase [Desulfosarcina sp.]|nr:GMC family oxidoreductase [Desulfosarcina sp.]